MANLLNKIVDKRANAPSTDDPHGFCKEQKEDLRELRAEILDLQEMLDDVSKGDTTLTLCRDYIETTKTDIKKILDKFSSPNLNSNRREDLRRIRNVWEQMESNPIIKGLDGEINAEQQLHYMNMLNKRIRKMIYLISYITIPERLNQWLEKALPGYYIPFHVVFADELPLLEDRVKLLEHLAYSPQTLKGGLVRAGNGLVYRYSMNVWERIFSIIELMVIFSLATILIYHISSLSEYIPEWPITAKMQSTLLLGWIAVIFGIITHAAIGAAKRGQSEGLPPIYATSDLSRYVNARFGLLVRKILLAMIGLFGLIFAYDPNSVTLLNAFLVGYSLDSVVGLFGSSLEQKSASQLTALRKQLDISEDA